LIVYASPNSLSSHSFVHCKIPQLRHVSISSSLFVFLCHLAKILSPNPRLSVIVILACTPGCVYR
jgi:hypothetical protein